MWSPAAKLPKTVYHLSNDDDILIFDTPLSAQGAIITTIIN